MATLKVQLDPDRTKAGAISLINKNGQTVQFLSALGKASKTDAAAHRNPGCSTLLPYGDTPLGGYNVVRIEDTSRFTGKPLNSYGNKGRIRIEPVSGEALLAKQNGRSGLLIHGKGADYTVNKLIVTNGCIRMLNSEIEVLIRAMIDLQIAGDAVTTCTVEHIGNNNARCDPAVSVDEGDPPA